MPMLTRNEPGFRLGQVGARLPVQALKNGKYNAESGCERADATWCLESVLPLPLLALR